MMKAFGSNGAAVRTKVMRPEHPKTKETGPVSIKVGSSGEKVFSKLALLSLFFLLFSFLLSCVRAWHTGHRLLPTARVFGATVAAALHTRVI